MLGALGRVWLTDTLACKRVPGCAYLQSVAEAALSSGVAADDVDAIEIEAGWLTCEMEELGRGPDLTPVRVNFSATLTTAIALLAGQLTPAELRPRWLAENAAAIRGLAARIRLRHDPALTARTLLGTLAAGASLDDVSLRDFLGIRRRLGDLNMNEANPAPALLRAAASDRRLRGVLAGSLRGRRRARRSGGGVGDLDPGALRMTFPSRMRIQLRDGTTRLLEGAEPGSCGHPVEEQRAVVEEKLAVAGAVVRAGA
jgi:hypothetical protein